MNTGGSIKEFLDHNTTCPICSNELDIGLVSRNIKSSVYEDNRLIIYRRLNPLHRKGNKYIVGYSFDGTDNSFIIEFYDAFYNKMSAVPITVLGLFKKMHNNFGGVLQHFSLYKNCPKCSRYNYQSTRFKFDLQTQTIEPIFINKEFIALSKKTNDKYKLYKLVNYFGNNITAVEYTIRESESESKFTNWSELDGGYLDLPLMQFTDTELMVDKLGVLITFS